VTSPKFFTALICPLLTHTLEHFENLYSEKPRPRTRCRGQDQGLVLEDSIAEDNQQMDGWLVNRKFSKYEKEKLN